MKQKEIANFVDERVLDYSDRSKLDEKEIYELIKFVGFRRLDSKELANFLVGMGQFVGPALRDGLRQFLNKKEEYKLENSTRKKKMFIHFIMNRNVSEDLNDELDTEINTMGSTYNKNVEEIESEDFDYQLRKLEDELQE